MRKHRRTSARRKPNDSSCAKKEASSRWSRERSGFRLAPSSRANTIRSPLTAASGTIGPLRIAIPSWEVCGLLDAFSLQQMAVLMSREGFQPGSNGEAQHGNKGILESDAVYVVVTGATDKA